MIIRQILSVCVVIGLMAPMEVNSAPQTEQTPLLKIKAQDPSATSKEDNKNTTRFSWLRAGLILGGALLLYGKLGRMWSSWRSVNHRRPAPPAAPSLKDLPHAGDFFVTPEDKKALIAKQELEKMQAELHTAKKERILAIAKDVLEQMNDYFKIDPRDNMLIEAHQLSTDYKIPRVYTRANLKPLFTMLTAELAGAKPTCEFNLNKIKIMPAAAQRIYERLNITYPPLSLIEQGVLIGFMEFEAKISSDIHNLNNLQNIQNYQIDPGWRPTHVPLKATRNILDIRTNITNAEHSDPFLKNTWNHLNIIISDPLRFNSSNLSFISYKMYHVLKAGQEVQILSDAQFIECVKGVHKFIKDAGGFLLEKGLVTPKQLEDATSSLYQIPSNALSSTTDDPNLSIDWQ